MKIYGNALLVYRIKTDFLFVETEDCGKQYLGMIFVENKLCVPSLVRDVAFERGIFFQSI